MNAPQITETLRRFFEQDNERVVFWYDDEAEFEDQLEFLQLDDVKVLRLDQLSALETKILLEIKDKQSKYLIYAPFSHPDLEKDWLLDVRLYSREFYADSASIVLDQLELVNQSLREHLAKRIMFFRSQERLKALKRWISSTDSAPEIDKKIIAVLARAEQPELFTILIKLFSEFCQTEQIDLSKNTRGFTEIEKYNLKEAFWDLVKQNFGYSESDPSLSNLLIKLLVTDFAKALKTELPKPLKHFLLTNQDLSLNASVLMSQWRNHLNYLLSYNSLSNYIEKQLRLDDHLNKLDETSLVEVMTFEAVEQHIARCLRDQVINDNKYLQIEQLRTIIAKRCDGHWSKIIDKVSDKGKHYRAVYTAIEAAAEIMLLRRQYTDGFIYANSKAMYEAYTKELYRFDQLYRLFHEAADKVELQWDILKNLGNVIEDCYVNWFIDQLAAKWGEFIDHNDEYSLLKNWEIEGINNQQNFYKSQVKPRLDESPQSKVYVVISDALRYEVAEELAKEINSTNRLKAALSSQLAVLPSYTALGMAALLPHSEMEYRANAENVYIDGQSTAGTEQRANILEKFQGTAISYEKLLEMPRDKRREYVKAWRVIYVYHNRIDAIGDKADTESKTFDAAREAIEELSSLVRLIINELNGSQVFVTADHGFLFQDSSLKQQDKSKLDNEPDGTLKAKKRYLLGKNLGKDINVWKGETKTTAGINGDIEFWVPKGANRFHFVGGSRFVHGGAMLQEIVVPIIFVKELRGQAAERAAVRKVDVTWLSQIKKVVNNVQRFSFIQTEPISERVQPRTLLISLRDADSLISTEVTLTFDSQSLIMQEREKIAQLTIQSGNYDKKKDYFLVLRDAENQIEYERFSVTIDLAFLNDF